MTDQEIVGRAALWLDAVKPGWASLVKLDVLNMQSGKNCISGQVFGYGTWEETASEFRTLIGITDDLGVFAQFDELWIEQVKIRLPIPTKESIANAVLRGETSGDGWKIVYS